MLWSLFYFFFGGRQFRALYLFKSFLRANKKGGPSLRLRYIYSWPRRREQESKKKISSKHYKEGCSVVIFPYTRSYHHHISTSSIISLSLFIFTITVFYQYYEYTSSSTRSIILYTYKIYIRLKKTIKYKKKKPDKNW